MISERKTIYDIVQEMEENDSSGTTYISKYVNFEFRETIDTIDAYINSKHISGDTDSLGREKPFFNIVTSSRNIYYRATDLDRKDIIIKPTKSSDVMKAFLATVHLQEWMRKEKFGMWLNEWGRTLATYGSAVSKFVEKDGELHAQVIPWGRLLIDPIDFDNNVVIEKLFLTEYQLRNSGYDEEVVQKIVDNPVSRENMDGTKKDTKDDYYEIFEVHGMLPESFLTDNDEDEDLTQQMHVVSFLGTGGSQKEFTLFSGKEKISPYKIAHLIPEDGRSLSIGSVEQLFNTQWMMNHEQKLIKDQLDLASKIIFQTADGNFVGKNALTNIENGQILIHSPNNPLTALANRPDITAMQSFGAQWEALGNRVNGISEAMQGQAPKAGAAWRQVEATLQESRSLFELMGENKGLYLKEIIRDHVLPFIKKGLNNKDEIATILEDYQIEQIDRAYISNVATSRVNDVIKETILSGEIYDPAEQEGLQASQEELIKNSLKPLGNTRFIKADQFDKITWKEYFKDMEWDLEISITNEEKNVQAFLTTLNSVFQTVASNPGVLADPNAKLVFNKILNEVGSISPVELQTAQSAPQPQTQPLPSLAPQV